MTDIKELALRVAKESPWYYDNEPVGDSDAIDFAQRFLVAYLAEQEPVAYLYQLIVEDQVVNQQGSTINWNPDYHPFGRKGIDYSASGTVIKQPLFTAPPEPEPQQDKQESGDYGLTGSSAACAAPSSEEVRETVERLCQATPEWLPQALYAQAADLTKRLATRAEKYSELLYAVERKFPNETRHQTALRYIQQAEAAALQSGEAQA